MFLRIDDKQFGNLKDFFVYSRADSQHIASLQVRPLGVHVCIFRRGFSKGFSDTRSKLCLLSLVKSCKKRWVLLLILRTQIMFAQIGAKTLGHRELIRMLWWGNLRQRSDPARYFSELFAGEACSKEFYSTRCFYERKRCSHESLQSFTDSVLKNVNMSLLADRANWALRIIVL